MRLQLERKRSGYRMSVEAAERSEAAAGKRRNELSEGVQ